MSKLSTLPKLIEKEKLLYLEVEQLRTTLYLHDTSILFEVFSAFYFAAQDIKKFFIQNKEENLTTCEIKKRSISSLLRKRKSLLFLNKTPYAWIVYGAKALKNAFLTRPQSSESEKKVLLIFGTTNAGDLQSRSIQIARKLSHKQKVIYIEGVFNEGKKAGYHISEQSKQFTSIRLTAYKSLHLWYQKPSPTEISLLRQSYKLFTKDFLLSNFETYIHHPFWSMILSLRNKPFYFDRGSHFMHHNNASKHIIVAEKKLLKNAYIVTAPHQKLLRNKKDQVIKNGVDWDFFKDASKMIQTCDVGLCWIKKPVIGYIGTLDECVDEILLGSIATAFPAASLVLVGNTDYRPIIEVAEKFPNIFPVGKQPYKKLPLFLQSFDILISPFKYNKKAPMIHPELSLYLASGKPIVATTSLLGCLPAEEKIRLRGRRPRVEPERRRAKGAIYQPKTHIDWHLGIAEALREKPRSKKKYLRIAAAKKLSWKIPRLY